MTTVSVDARLNSSSTLMALGSRILLRAGIGGTTVAVRSSFSIWFASSLLEQPLSRCASLHRIWKIHMSPKLPEHGLDKTFVATFVWHQGLEGPTRPPPINRDRKPCDIVGTISGACCNYTS